MEDDPFGSRPSVRRHGWIRLLLGVILLVGGVGATVAGIVQAIEARNRIESRAVARGTVRDGLRGAVAFDVPEGERRRYAVYLLLKGGLVRNSENDDLVARDTGCVASMPDGVLTRFSGSRQTISETLGNAVSVGRFTSQPGRVSIVCGYVSGTRRSERVRPDGVPYVVTEGGPSWTSSGVLTIIGGITAGILGGFLFGWGWRGRRRVV